MRPVWKVAPGENAWVWDECLEGRCITINWLNHKNFAAFQDKQEVKKALIKDGGKGGGAYSIWQFCRGIQQGHVVVANSGLSTVVGIGLVRSGYLPPGDARNPRKDKAYHRHARLVDWAVDKPLDFEARVFNQPTVQQLTPETIDLIIKAYSKHHPGLRKTLEVIFRQRIGPAGDEAGPSVDPEYVGPDGDQREVAWQQIKRRRGQPQFRHALLQRYERRCLITGCCLEAVLESAHIDPYRGESSNHPGNGLLLRADIHTLFDLDLLGIEPDSLRIELHPDIAKEYRAIIGKVLRCAKGRRPLQQALKRRYRIFQERQQWPA